MQPSVTEEIEVQTRRRNEMVEITSAVEKLCKRAELNDGIVYVFVPHTTAGVTIQENADPDVKHDLLAKLEALIPHREDYYRHAEGNSDSHLKTAFVGNSATIFALNQKPTLGTWQGVYLCEFDGPRTRTVIFKAVQTGRSDRT